MEHLLELIALGLKVLYKAPLSRSNGAKVHYSSIPAELFDLALKSFIEPIPLLLIARISVSSTLQ